MEGSRARRDLPDEKLATLDCDDGASPRDRERLIPRTPPPEADSALQEAVSALDRIAWGSLGTGEGGSLRAYSLTFTRLGAPSEATRQRLIARFDPLFPAATRDLNIQLANLLVYLQSPAIAPKAMAALRRASTQEEQIEYALALRALKVGWTQPLREQYFRWFVSTAPGYRGGNTFARALSTIKSDAVKS